MIPLSLPTDEFNQSYHFSGAGRERHDQGRRYHRLRFCRGHVQYLRHDVVSRAQAEDAAIALFLDRRLSPKLRLFSRNFVSVRATSISGVEWQPLAQLKIALSGGLGANQGYFGSSLTFERRWLSFKGAYIGAGNGFRRVVGNQLPNSESVRENLLVSFHPSQFFDLSAGRFNLLQPVDGIQPQLGAVLDQYSASFYAAGGGG